MGFAASRPLLFSTDSPVVGPVQPGESHRCHFAVFRADSVSVTSTKFAGGDWRWRLSDQEGAILVQAGGYRSEAHCRDPAGSRGARHGRVTHAEPAYHCLFAYGANGRRRRGGDLVEGPPLEPSHLRTPPKERPGRVPQEA